MKILIAAKQNQKFPFHFLSAHPTPPAEEKKKGKENFWFLLPRPKGADEARIIGLFAQRKFAQRLLFHRIIFFFFRKYFNVEKASIGAIFLVSYKCYPQTIWEPPGRFYPLNLYRD